MDFKFKIYDKVKYMNDLVGTIVDCEKTLMMDTEFNIYLIRYDTGFELWAFESSLEKYEGSEEHVKD